MDGQGLRNRGLSIARMILSVCFSLLRVNREWTEQTVRSTP